MGRIVVMAGSSFRLFFGVLARIRCAWPSRIVSGFRRFFAAVSPTHGTLPGGPSGGVSEGASSPKAARRRFTSPEVCTIRSGRMKSTTPTQRRLLQERCSTATIRLPARSSVSAAQGFSKRAFTASSAVFASRIAATSSRDAPARTAQEASVSRRPSL